LIKLMPVPSMALFPKFTTKKSSPISAVNQWHC
jgi:hypothetical protein